MENELSYKIIGAAIEVQRALGGPGLLENIYEEALCHELTLHGLKYERQLPVKVIYKGVTISDPLYVDILVENKVIVEVKATEKTPYCIRDSGSHIFTLNRQKAWLVN